MNCFAGPLLIKQVFDSGFGLKEDWICLFACGEASDFEVEIRRISVNWQRPVQTDTPPAYKQDSNALPHRTSSTESDRAEQGDSSYFSCIVLLMSGSSHTFSLPFLFLFSFKLGACESMKTDCWHTSCDRDENTNSWQILIKDIS